ncbi:MAG: DUF1295 domain-containing protein [Kofleriaceae bacterium]
MIHLLALSWLAAAALQLALWLVAQRTRNASIVDVGWAGSFAVVAALLAAQATTAPAIFAPVTVVVIAWSLRLTWHLLRRGAATGPEEGRYRDLRQRWAPHAERAFFLFFQAQAALTAILAVSIIPPFLWTPRPSLELLRWLGVAISAIAIVGETVADLQLKRFRRAHAGERRVCDVGLWRYSRHPNYFFEWIYWLGLAVHGLAFAPWGLVALLGQAIILASIFGVTGIPPTEAQALRSRGDAYRAYQQRVSRFVPWPPKSRQNDA